MNHLTLLSAIFLGLIQGATEFLPVSSSGHLVIFQALLGVNLEGGGLLAFDVCLHFGTLVAIVAVFWRDLADIVAAFLNISNKDEKYVEARKLGIYLIIGTIPAGIIGVLIKDIMERLISDALAAGVMLLITGAILFGTSFVKPKEITLSNMKWWRVIGVGIAQAIAIIPGISRSGSTIAGGLYLGLEREFAARFAFLLAVPAIAGATVLQIKDLKNLSSDILLATAVGTLVAAVVGFVCVKWMLGVVKRGRLSWFAYYCFAAGLAAILFFAK